MGSMASKRLARSCAGREGVRERASLLDGDTEDASFRGDVLALLLTSKRCDLLAVGEVALAGRCGSDLVELRFAEEEPGLGNKPGVAAEADFEVKVALDAEAPPVGVAVDEILLDA